MNNNKNIPMVNVLMTENGPVELREWTDPKILLDAIEQLAQEVQDLRNEVQESHNNMMHYMRHYL